MNELEKKLVTRDEEVKETKSLKKAIKQKNRLIDKLRHDMTKRGDDLQLEIKTLKQEVDRKNELIKKLRAAKVRNEFKVSPSVNDIGSGSVSEILNYETEKRVNKQVSKQSSQSPEKEKVVKRITDTGSSYPSEANLKSEINIESKNERLVHHAVRDITESDLGSSKSMTLPPPAKDLKDLKAPMLQFLSVLRISNVGVKDFMDTVVFKDKKPMIKFSDFKVKIEAILK